MSPTDFRFTPFYGVIIVSGVVSVLSVACIVAMVIATRQKLSHRHRREHSSEGRKTTVVDGGIAAAEAYSGDQHQTDAFDDALENNPDIIPHENG